MTYPNMTHPNMTKNTQKRLYQNVTNLKWDIYIGIECSYYVGDNLELGITIKRLPGMDIPIVTSNSIDTWNGQITIVTTDSRNT